MLRFSINQVSKIQFRVSAFLLLTTLFCLIVSSTFGKPPEFSKSKSEQTIIQKLLSENSIFNNCFIKNFCFRNSSLDFFTIRQRSIEKSKYTSITNGIQTLESSESSAPTSFTNSRSIVIPAANSVIGGGGSAKPYSSNISVSGLNGTISDLNVKINNFSHSYPDDVVMLLVAPTGENFMLQSDVGGKNKVTNISYTFDDQAVAIINDSGPYPNNNTSVKPSSVGNNEILLPPAPYPPYNHPAPADSATLNGVFGGLNPNGKWKLFVFDFFAGNSGSIRGGWSLEITTTGNTVVSPSITNFNPTSQVLGGTNFDLTVNGSNFNPNSVVKWNGQNNPTSFVSASQLKAQISASDIQTAGQYPVTVFDPQAGKISNAVKTISISEKIRIAAESKKDKNKSDDSSRSAKAEFQTNSKTSSKAVSNQTGNVFFAAPNGNASGNGSINNPWDLKTAFSHPAAVQPGDTIYLRGGTYRVPTDKLGFISQLTGTLENPIKVMNYSEEWAVIDGNISYSQVKNVTIIKIIGEYTWYKGFEITNSDNGNRKIDIPGSNPPERRATAILDQGIGNKIINTVIHDTGQGISSYSAARNGEYYGNVIYNNGWDAPDRLNGHGFYLQNNSDFKKLEENITLNGFGRNLVMYGSSSAFCRNFTWIGNVTFNGGMAWWGPYLENLVVKENHFYNQQFSLNPSIYVTNTDADVEDNYFMSGATIGEFGQNLTFKNNNIWNPGSGTTLTITTIDFWTPSRFTFDNNIYYKNNNNISSGQFRLSYIGKSREYAFNKTAEPQRYASTKKAWQEDLGLDTNGTYITSAPSGVEVIVRPNRYDSDRSNVIVYNWDQANTVNIDVSSILQSGDTYALHNVQDYFGDIITGTYSGGQINVNMTNRTCVKPIGYDQVSSWYHDPLQPCTFPTFGVFVLIKTN